MAVIPHGYEQETAIDTKGEIEDLSGTAWDWDFLLVVKMEKHLVHDGHSVAVLQSGKYNQEEAYICMKLVVEFENW